MTAMEVVVNNMTCVPDHQTTKPYCRVFHLGLEPAEALVIETLLQSNAELQRRYAYGPASGNDAVDLVVVNADSPDACAEFASLRRQRPEILGLMATAEDDDFEGFQIIRKPLTFRNVVAFLESLTSTSVRDIKGHCAGNALRILVVDDSLPARQFMKLKLEMLSRETGILLHVDMADCGEKALLIVQKHGFDLAFVDVVMPGVDGYEVCRQMKQVAPIRVAMLTGRASPVDFNRGRSAGCDNYLSKPANDVDVRTILRLSALKKMTASTGGAA